MQTVWEAKEGSVRGGRQISHTPLGWKYEPSTVACSSHFLVPAAVFFFPLIIPIVEKLSPAREITRATLWSHIFLISGYCGVSLGESNLTNGESWTNGKSKDGMTVSLQSKAAASLCVKYQPIPEWHHQKRLVWIARNKKKIKTPRNEPRILFH